LGLYHADIVSFWDGLPGDCRVHPADVDVLHRVQHHLQLDCLPGPFNGELKSAPVILLFLSPGFSDYDLKHAKSQIGQDYYKNSRSGFHSLPSTEEHTTSSSWTKSIIKQLDIDYESAREKVAFLNICPYKSTRFQDRHLLSALPSCRVAVSWAQSVLFPQAISGRRVVLCLRSAGYWGLKTGYSSGTLFAPPHTRAGIMHHDEYRRNVILAVKDALA
jgi:hypothetical protein